jgi:hypothetical protein
MYALVAWTRFPQTPRTPRLMAECFARRKCTLLEGRTPWYDPSLMPPVSLYVGGRDKLVDGRNLTERFETVGSGVVLVRGQVDPEFEHLDCIWGFDCIDRVAKNVRLDIWSTIPIDEDVILPQGCLQDNKGSKTKWDTSTQ